MSIVNGIRTIDNLVAGNLSGAQLETWLGSGINKAGFAQALNSRSQVRLLAESLTALTAIAASPIALGVLASSSISSFILQVIAANSSMLTVVVATTSAMPVLAADSAAMTVIAESNTLLAIVFGTTSAKTALYDATAAKTALFASVNAKAYMVSIAAAVSTTSVTHVSVNSGKTFFIQQKSGGTTSYAGVSADTYSTTSSSYVDRFVALTGLTHRHNTGSNTSYVTYIDMD